MLFDKYVGKVVDICFGGQYASLPVSVETSCGMDLAIRRFGQCLDDGKREEG